MVRFMFEYAIQFPDGTFLADIICPNDVCKYIRGDKHQALTFTEKGARRAINQNSDVFLDAKVVKIL